MNRIIIQSTKKLQFPPRFYGFVSMEIDLIQNKPAENKYEIRIIDSVYEYEEQIIETVENNSEKHQAQQLQTKTETVRLKKILAQETRMRSYTYEELSQLSTLLALDKSQFSTETEYINELFRQGLLITTQKECIEGIAGKGFGMYFSASTDWIIKEEEEDENNI